MTEWRRGAGVSTYYMEKADGGGEFKHRYRTGPVDSPCPSPPDAPPDPTLPWLRFPLFI